MTNRLADEATYFGAVADGAASRDDEVAELRQQLADVKTVSDHNLKVYQEAAEKLRQQVTLLRDALTKERDLRVFGQSEECGKTHWESIMDMRRDVYKRTEEALAATAPKEQVK